jgi:hypothetical protein
MEVLHKDDNRANAAAINLEYGTHRKNCLDCIQRGRYNHKARGLPGELQPNAVLSTADVLEIRRFAGKVYQKDLAQKFGVCQQNISDILRRKTWAHV